MAKKDKEYTYNQELLLAGVKSTYGIPTVGLLAAGFLGFRYVAPKIDWFLKSSEEVLTEIEKTATGFYDDAIIRGLQFYKGAEQAIVPVTTFVDDAKACYESSKVSVPVLGRIWVPAVSSVQFQVCMGKKGYAGEIVQEYFNR